MQSPLIVEALVQDRQHDVRAAADRRVRRPGRARRHRVRAALVRAGSRLASI